MTEANVATVEIISLKLEESIEGEIPAMRAGEILEHIDSDSSRVRAKRRLRHRVWINRR
jgi:hypothetical protein